MLHGNDLQDSVLHVSVEKAGVFSCNIRNSEYALKYSGFNGSTCSLKYQKRRIRCHQTVSSFKKFTGKHASGPPSKRLRANRVRLRTFEPI